MAVAATALRRDRRRPVTAAFLSLTAGLVISAGIAGIAGLVRIRGLLQRVCFSLIVVWVILAATQQ